MYSFEFFRTSRDDGTNLNANTIPIMARIPTETPTTIPIMAPVDKVEDEDDVDVVGVGV